MENDYEITFWYTQATNKKPWIIAILAKYQNILDVVLAQIWHKFYNLPFEFQDLQLMQYVVVTNCLESFNSKYKKSFKNFLIQNYRWFIKNQINSFFTNKNKTLGFCSTLEFDEPAGALSIDRSLHKLWELKIIKLHLGALTDIEKLVIELKMKNYTIRDIVNETNLLYSQVDNSYNRAIKKLRKLIIK